MPIDTSAAELQQVTSLLAKLRDEPTDTQGAPDSILAPICTYLLKVPVNPSDGLLHWYCDRTDPVVREAATFLLRLHAYNSSRVDKWREKLALCLSGCAACVKVLQETKVSSRHTYFGAFSESIIEGFYRCVDEWECKLVTECLSKAGITPDMSPSDPGTLASAPNATFYHILSNLTILQNPLILALVRSRLPTSPFPEWPPDPPPVGLFFLLMDEKPETRRWARSQIAKATVVPIPREKYVGAYERALEPILAAVASLPSSSRPGALAGPEAPSATPAATTLSFPFAKDSASLWSGFAVVVRMTPHELLRPNKLSHVDLRQVIIGHLHDTGPQFSDVFRCFLYLIKRRGSDFWQGEEVDFPQVVFDAIKDNPAYTALIQSVDIAEEKPWFFAWFSEYLLSIWDLPVFGVVLAKLADYLCEELQHERFQDARPVVMVTAARTLSSVRRRAESSNVSTQRNALSGVLDIHADILVSVAFARPYSGPKWRKARTATRDLVKDILLRDAQNLATAVSELCKLIHAQADEPLALAHPDVRTQLWKHIYATLEFDDVDAIATITSVVARSSHMDFLNRNAFSGALQKGKVVDLIFTEANEALRIFRTGFLDAVAKFADRSNASVVLDLLRRPGMVKDIVTLMFSPIPDVQTAAQTLIGQAFNVDLRLDCFRALLENLPGPSLEGIIRFVETFNAYVRVVPEACSVSKSLVRCLTDIIEVLCSPPDGLLLNQRLMTGEGGNRVADDLPNLWGLMSKAIAMIFRLTPAWAPNFQNEEMTVWMRDALIFGRDMLAQRRVIEAASIPSVVQVRPPKGLSTVGKRMMNDLQDVIPELARWLRLTDEELLHQSFALLQTLLDSFRQTGVPPSESGTKKLNKFIEDARRNTTKGPRTHLDSARLSKLEDALAWFDSDGDVEIVGYKQPHHEPKDKESDVEIVELTHQSVAHRIVPRKSSIRDTDGLAARDTKKPSAERHPETRDRSDKLKVAPGMGHRGSGSVISGKPKNREIVRSSASASSAMGSSSGEETSEDEDGKKEQGGLASLGQLQRTPKVKKPVERRQVKMLDMPTTRRVEGRRVLTAREEAHRTALRLKPDVTSLHRAILSWNYDHQGPQPPTSVDTTKLVRIPDKFSDYGHYRRIFEPLLLLECWAQIAQSKDDPAKDVYECKLTSRAFVDDWVDLDISIMGNMTREWRLAETDVVLLRHPEGTKSVLAKTVSYKSTPFATQCVVRCFFPNGSGDPGLQVNSIWKLNKVFSLSTLHREYAALMGLPYFDSFDIILHPRLSKRPLISPEKVTQAMSTFNVNEPQALAILSSLATEGFSLIQGPPGTGKTSTICGLVQAFLAARPKPATIVHIGRTAGPTDKEPVKKILLCAPSNAAVDEIAYRLKEGVCGSGRRSSPIKVVRLGADMAVNISVKDITLDYLVEQKLNSDKDIAGQTKDSGNDITALRKEIETVKQLKAQKQEEMVSIHDNGVKTMALENDIRALNSRRMTLTQQVDRLRDQQQSNYRTLDATRRRFRKEVLVEADVICCTLAGAGHEILESFDFDMIIIDEAAQAIELSSLIPLKYRCKRCIMVGDPMQLPPTVISQEASKFLYNQSLFVRLQKDSPESMHLLSIQYRMHPQISELPSRVFYQGRLLDGPEMDVKTTQDWHSSEKFGPYRFYNVRGQEEQGSRHSLVNKYECQVAVALFDRLRREFPKFDFDYKVGVVSMYRAQIGEMRRSFEQRFGKAILDKVDFHTVDGFQGQEKLVIILSCVRAGPGLQSVGFLSDIRRMNVALTRAKSSLFVLGHIPTLERSDTTWKAIVEDARARDFLTEVPYFATPITKTGRPSLTAKPPKPAKHIETAIPSDLTTPRDFKVVTSKLNLDAAATIMAEAEIPTTNQPGVSGDDLQPQVGQKRRRTVVSPNHPDPAHRPATEPEDRAKPRPPPPPKRPKHGTTMFIPKPNKVSVPSSHRT
ncbi:hypothetical protein JAAARDRAFT_121642 [Jaapia argillacea MUCL 33604]|uniref:Helicase ATP-binding domain-containing protein n=1 Tax=Jaapia argillacea MUCL 33604 TaxID=933084 RepID=A0A067QG13_9AGAM|nr:hypothetical protein JAAARDRAFT_121642 [Jaapia argillacea MUCL 33604]